jgi:integrase
MPRQPQPWFRAGRGWHVQLRGKKVFLGHDREESYRKFHTLMAGGDAPPPAVPTDDTPVVSILDAFLDWLAHRVREGSKAQRTYDWYRDYLQDFVRFETGSYRVRELSVTGLEPIHVYQWADSHPGWKTGKRGAMTAVQRAFNWAAKAGLLKAAGGRSPLAALEKPPQGRRERLVSAGEYREVMSLVRDEEFRDVLELAWETGCRPHELFTVEASHVDLATGRWVFPIKLSKGRKVQRVVFLNDRALEVTRRLVLKHPSGPLLRNTGGVPWCASAVKCRFQQLCRTLGRRRLREQGLLPPIIPRLAASQRNDPEARRRHREQVLERRKRVNELAWGHGTRLNLYAFRHSLITESLVNGLDAVTVSVLAGHRDTSMISRHTGCRSTS